MVNASHIRQSDPYYRYLQHRHYISAKDKDFTLHCRDKSYEVHRSIIASKSAFFKALVSNGFKESRQQEAVIEETEPLVLDSVLYFMYTGEFPLDVMHQQWRSEWWSLYSASEREFMKGAYPGVPEQPLRDATPEEKSRAYHEMNLLRFQTIVQAYELADWFLVTEEDLQDIFSEIVAKFSEAFRRDSMFPRPKNLTVSDVPILLETVYDYTSEAGTRLRGAVMAKCLEYKAKLEGTEACTRI